MLYCFYSKQTELATMSEDNNNYVKLKSNCNQCGTVMTYGWTLTCAACQTNKLLVQQNKLLAQQAAAGGGGLSGGFDTDPPPWALYIALLILIAVIVIGFVFFPHWGIVTFVKFLWTLAKLFIAFFLVIPLFLWKVLF
jgi:hypothetical protein